MAEDRVVVVTVEGRAAALSLLDTWRRGASGIDVRAGAIVHRDDRGELQVSDRTGEEPAWPSPPAPRGAASGLLGVLAASVDAIFLGNSTMALLGAAAPAPDAAAVVELLTRPLPSGGTALVALVSEAEPGAVESAADGGSVEGWSAERLRSALDGG